MARIARPVVALTLTAAAFAAVSSNAAAVELPAGLCDGHAFSTPFAALGDTAPYTLVPGGDFEGTLTGWTLGAKVVTVRDRLDNLGLGGDQRSLSLPKGTSVTTPAICVTTDYPYFRFFARSKSGSTDSRLTVEVIYEGTSPATVITVASLKGTDMATWKATPQLRTGVYLATLAANLSSAKAIMDGSQQVVSAGAMRVRLTAVAQTWEVDNLYVDPRMR